MLINLILAVALPSPGRLLNEELPRCFCDTLSHGFSTADNGKHACMKWHKNNPFLSAIKAFDQDKLPKPEGPDTGGYQIECIRPDKGLKTGAADEFEKGWQGNCASDFTKCVYVHETPEWQEGCGGAGCECHIYRNGAHPVHNQKHMCITTEKVEGKDGKFTDQNVCTPPANGYEARFGEGLMNYGCPHPARPCGIDSTVGDDVCKACLVKGPCAAVGELKADAAILCRTYAESCLGDDGILCLPKSVKEVPQNALVSCEDIKAVGMPGTTTVGDYAFSSFTYLAALYVPMLKHISNSAFMYTALTSLSMPELTHLGSYAFAYSQLKSISMPKIKTGGDVDNAGPSLDNLEQLESIAPDQPPANFGVNADYGIGSSSAASTKCCMDKTCQAWCFSP